MYAEPLPVPAQPAELPEAFESFEAVGRRDLVQLCGVSRSPLARRALELVLGGRVRRFAQALATFNQDIARVGLARGALTLCARYGGTVVTEGTEHVPRDGPVLLVSNHPGLMDALALYGTVPRPDIMALARPQPLLLLLTALAPHLLLLPDDGPGRATGLRDILRTLRAGGCLLLFPAGHLEPEPTLLRRHPQGGSAPAEPFAPWSSGVGTLVRMAARQRIPLRIVPVGVSGALSSSTFRWFGPLLRLRKTLRGREDLLAVLQVAFPSLGPTTVRVRYGRPLDAAALAVETDGDLIAARIQREVGALLPRT